MHSNNCLTFPFHATKPSNNTYSRIIHFSKQSISCIIACGNGQSKNLSSINRHSSVFDDAILSYASASYFHTTE